jgi:hypothetical protein
MPTTTARILLPGAAVHRRLRPLPSERSGQAAQTSSEASTVRAIRSLFESPRVARAERPWSRLQLEVRAEFVEAQRWARR